MHDRPLISAFIICMNEERQIRRCLESIKWCDEIIVIDSGSTDATLSICREYTDKIFERAWPGFIEQKRFGLEKCKGEWVLNLDADEVVTPELEKEIKDTIRGEHPANGYHLLRVVFYLGKFWRKGGWYPEYRLRLCRRSATTWGGEDPHEKAIVDGLTARLKGELQHYTYHDISNQIRTLNSFASASAETMWRKGERANIFRILGNPAARFVKFYLLRKGFLEGFSGFVVAIIESFYVFLKYIKLWEKEISPNTTPKER
jgi:glycosyltransferase involved in cell wall biosynthesis